MSELINKNGLIEDTNLREKYYRKYQSISKEYNQLGKNINEDIDKLLENENINILSVNYRIKDFDRFLDKIKRKKYDDPLNEIEDICGLRIICYYTSDLEKIASIIKKEFDVIDSVDKADLLREDEFGYLSQHFIIKLKKSWLNTPRYRNIGNLKAEIQLRTVLMHAWANISHSLVYKKKKQAPHQFMRRLNGLSAILEIADDAFNNLKNDREKFIEEISRKTEKSGSFDLDQELNLDSFQAFLDFHFPNRLKSISLTIDLLDEIILFNKLYGNKITFKSILEAFKKSKDIIAIEEISIFAKIDKKDVEKMEKNNYRKFLEMSNDNEYFTQVGVIRIALTYQYPDYDEYWNKKIDDQIKEHNSI